MHKLKWVLIFDYESCFFWLSPPVSSLLFLFFLLSSFYTYAYMNLAQIVKFSSLLAFRLLISRSTWLNRLVYSRVSQPVGHQIIFDESRPGSLLLKLSTFDKSNVAVDCIALNHWGKHKQKMVVRGINWQESNQQQQSSLDEFTLLLLGCTVIIYAIYRDKWITIIHLWWLSQWTVTHGHHLAVTIYLHVAPSPGRHTNLR